MKIMLVTQEDAFYIPQLIARLMPERHADIMGVTVLAGEVSKRNIRKYIDFMGPFDFVRYAANYALYGALNRIFPRGVGHRFFSVTAVARRYQLPVFTPANVNQESYLKVLRALGVDLVVSVAAPQIFKKPLLDLPALGCINIHNALLPQYQGVLPSFHVLANGEEHTGTSVHYMVEKIDAGDIIVQEKFKIEAHDTLHSLVYRTKITIGPRLLLQAITQIENGSVQTLDVDWSQATYFSFPDADAVRRFRARGRKFG